MKILVTGSTGLVGQRLVPALLAERHEVVRLVRDRASAGGDAAYWDPKTGQIDAAALAGCDAAVNLAGASIAAGRWTEKRKREIRESRVDATRTIATALARLEPRPKVLINASAIGFYGSRGDQRLDEASAAGSGDFLSSVCRDWEAAAAPAVQAGIRTVFCRFGVILSGNGGALGQMLTPFKLGLGGKIGSGQQYMSWVTIDDAIGAILHCLNTASVSGPVNVITPSPVTNAEFAKTLGKALSRPAVLPMPAFAARLAFGQMGQELLLGSQRVYPTQLLEARYMFKYPQLAGALEHVLAR